MNVIRSGSESGKQIIPLLGPDTIVTRRENNDAAMEERMER
jgi:hypothetical protein